jgi:PIF1 helicase.
LNPGDLELTVLFSGDFRQILPIINRGTRADEVNVSLKTLYLWPYITKCELKTNMRIVSSRKDNRQFSIDLIQIDNGVNDFITLNNLHALVKNVEELIEKVYPDISNISTKPLNWFQERAILSPTNEEIDKASSQTYYSVSTVMDREEAVHYPTKFLN